MGLFSRRTPMPTPEQRYYADEANSDKRRSDAAAHYRKTGDSSRMWEEKSRHVDGVRAMRDYQETRAGRREAKRTGRWY
jgi:hypothetical protein